MSLLEFREVSKRFPDGLRDVLVLDRVSFEVDADEIVGLLAARRAGKTTLLEIAAGLQEPDEGEVLWDAVDLAKAGRDRCARARRRGGIGLVRGDWHPGRSMSVVQHVATPLYSDGFKMAEAERQARWALELVKASGLSHLSTTVLGQHERVTVDLARAVVCRPRLLLVDEPAVLRHPDEARQLYELLHSLPGRVGCALLIASEDISALRGCKPMMSLADGRLHSTSARRKVIDFPSVASGGRAAAPDAS